MIPAEARATLMFRTVADPGPLEAAIVEAAGPEVEVSWLGRFGPVRAPALPGWDTTTVKYASDLSHLGPWGVGYQLGPGTIKVAHTAEERIRKQELVEGVGCYVRLVRQLLVSVRHEPR